MPNKIYKIIKLFWPLLQPKHIYNIQIFSIKAHVGIVLIIYLF